MEAKENEDNAKPTKQLTLRIKSGSRITRLGSSRIEIDTSQSLDQPRAKGSLLVNYLPSQT